MENEKIAQRLFQAQTELVGLLWKQMRNFTLGYILFFSIGYLAYGATGMAWAGVALTAINIALNILNKSED